MDIFHLSETSCRLSLVLQLLLLSYSVRDAEQSSSPIPYAHSPVYLQYLEDVEALLVQSIEEEMLTLEEGLDSELLDVLKRYLKDYKESMQNSDHSGHFISDNPILTLMMLNRFQKISEVLDSNLTLSRILNDTSNGEALPITTYIVDLADSFLFTQYVYDLDSNQIADGILMDGIPTNARFTFGSCFQFGRFAQKKLYFTLALQWYGVALEKFRTATQLENLSYESAMMEQNVLMGIMNTIETHTNYFGHQLHVANRGFHRFTSPIQFTGTAVNFAEHRTERQAIVDEFTGSVILDEQDPKYHFALEANKLALCSGKDFHPERLKARLKCYLDTSRHLYFRINPLKVEIIHETPQITRVYDIISNQAAATLKFTSYSKLDRVPPESQTGTLKVAAYAWIDDFQIPQIKISKIVEFITGLTVDHSESSDPIEVAAYAFGGHVSPHYDSFSAGENHSSSNSKDQLLGPRVNTFLFYLNDVEVGGRTAFPFLGVSIKPVKNSAVFWYNNLKNGMNDQRMLHLACPVIKGHKWIATKWTRLNKNLLRYPCGLTQDE